MKFSNIKQPKKQNEIYTRINASHNFPFSDTISTKQQPNLELHHQPKTFQLRQKLNFYFLQPSRQTSLWSQFNSSESEPENSNAKVSFCFTSRYNQFRNYYRWLSSPFPCAQKLHNFTYLDLRVTWTGKVESCGRGVISPKIENLLSLIFAEHADVVFAGDFVTFWGRDCTMGWVWKQKYVCLKRKPHLSNFKYVFTQKLP